MIRRNLLCGLALLILAPIMIPQTAHAQGPFTFAGKWRLTLDLGPGVSLQYDITTTTATPNLPNQGGGIAIRTADAALPPELRRTYGITWRHQNDAMGAVLGVRLCFEVFSTMSPTTFIIRGGTGNTIMGNAQGIDENTSSNAATFDSKFGFGVAPVAFKLERLP